MTKSDDLNSQTEDNEPDSQILYDPATEEPGSLARRVTEFFGWHHRNGTRVSAQPEGTAFHD